MGVPPPPPGTHLTATNFWISIESTVTEVLQILVSAMSSRICLSRVHNSIYFHFTSQKKKKSQSYPIFTLRIQHNQHLSGSAVFVSISYFSICIQMIFEVIFRTSIKQIALLNSTSFPAIPSYFKTDSGYNRKCAFKMSAPFR